MKFKPQKKNLDVIDAYNFQLNPARYELRSGIPLDAPSCPYGGRFKWIGYDLEEKRYVRVTKSVFKRMIASLDVGFVKENERLHAEQHD